MSQVQAPKGGVLLDDDRRPGQSMTTQQAVANIAVLRDELLKIHPLVRTSYQVALIRTFDQIVAMWGQYQAELMGLIPRK